MKQIFKKAWEKMKPKKRAILIVLLIFITTFRYYPQRQQTSISIPPTLERVLPQAKTNQPTIYILEYNAYGKKPGSPSSTYWDLTEKLTGPNLQNLESSEDLKLPFIAGGMDDFMFQQKQGFLKITFDNEGNLICHSITDDEMTQIILNLKKNSQKGSSGKHN